MNIFILDYDHQKNAEYHCATHTTKMISEYSQLLSTAIEETTGSIVQVSEKDLLEFKNLYPKALTITIKKTHSKHPSALWVKESYSNFQWLLGLLDALHTEWQYKFNHSKDKIHGTYYKFLSGFIEPNIKDVGMTPFRLAMPIECMVYGDNCDSVGGYDSVASYRNYYNVGKRHLFEWKNRDVPEWIL